MNAADVIKGARRWADLHRANTHQREGVKRVDALLAVAEEQAATLDRVEALADQWETTHPADRGHDSGHINGLVEAAGDLRRAIKGGGQ